MLLLIHISRTDSYCYTQGLQVEVWEGWSCSSLSCKGLGDFLSALTVVSLCFALTHSPLCFLCLLHKPFRHL